MVEWDITQKLMKAFPNGDIPYSDIYCCYKCGAKMDGGKAE